MPWILGGKLLNIQVNRHYLIDTNGRSRIKVVHNPHALISSNHTVDSGRSKIMNPLGDVQEGIEDVAVRAAELLH